VQGNKTHSADDHPGLPAHSLHQTSSPCTGILSSATGLSHCRNCAHWRILLQAGRGEGGQGCTTLGRVQSIPAPACHAACSLWGAMKLCQPAGAGGAHRACVRMHASFRPGGIGLCPSLPLCRSWPPSAWRAPLGTTGTSVPSSCWRDRLEERGVPIQLPGEHSPLSCTSPHAHPSPPLGSRVHFVGMNSSEKTAVESGKGAGRKLFLTESLLMARPRCFFVRFLALLEHCYPISPPSLGRLG